MSRTRPYYSLKGVYRLLATEDGCEINSKAQRSAKKDFGWDRSDIIKALKKLRLKHFHKSDFKYDNPTIYVDYYKAYGVMGENVYTHFRIEDGKLYICSLKEVK